MKNGYTLMELIIVVVLLGVFATMALPRYIDLTNTAKKNATIASLGTLRAAIAIKYAEAFLAGSASYPAIAGSLFVGGAIPADGYLNSNAVSASAENPIATFTDTGGWIYNSTTGEIRANVPLGHAW